MQISTNNQGFALHFLVVSLSLFDKDIHRSYLLRIALLYVNISAVEELVVLIVKVHQSPTVLLFTVLKRKGVEAAGNKCTGKICPLP